MSSAPLRAASEASSSRRSSVLLRSRITGSACTHATVTGLSIATAYAREMSKVYEAIDEKLGAWIERQHLFFVATAPLAADGPVNMSPKGDLRWFRILAPREVGYLDFIGSGAETIAHARENGRIVARRRLRLVHR